jgi:carboxyl-terminal processing protease
MKKVLSYVLTALLSCSLTLTAVIFATRDTEQYSKLTQLQQVIDLYFINEPDKQAMEDAAADAMVSMLGDRWSYYMTAEEYASYVDTMANSYVGVGMTVQLNADGKGIDVVQITPGGPAEEAGIQNGDILVAVDGQSIAGMDLTAASALVKGESGTQVKLTVLRGDQQIEITATRRAIQTPVATATMLEGKVGLVRIVNFDSRCFDETKAAIESLVEQGAQSLIFDVRFNPGGYKAELVKVLDYLLPEGEIFRSEYYNGTVSTDRSDAKCLQMPMAVLINQDSYSAAEFFAAALAEYDWAVTVGTQTCGKSYFQNCYRLSDGSAVNISIGKYFTPKGVSLAEVGGLVPNVVVEVEEDVAAGIYYGTIEPMEDPQILAAIEALQKR